MHPFQHLKAVDFRHDDVEEHKVEPLTLEQIERDASVGRRHDVVSLPLEAPCQHGSIVLNVIHDENARRRSIRRARWRRALDRFERGGCVGGARHGARHGGQPRGGGGDLRQILEGDGVGRQ